MLGGAFPDITVEGEVSNARRAASGHLYFSLKDRRAVLQAAMFRTQLARADFIPHDGMLIRARGAIDVYEQRGTYQLVVETVQRAGTGDLLALLEERKRRLAARGCFALERKRPIPRVPRRVVVITSPAGAALRDILDVLRRRHAGIDLVILPAQVQGAGAAGIIASRLRTASRHRMGDVVVLARGGGSLEDLLPFSDEAVVEAIVRCELPVVSAVGHQTDTSLADLAADVRAPTPSAAAELVSSERSDLLRRLHAAAGSMRSSLDQRRERVRFALKRFQPAGLERSLRLALAPATQRLDDAVAAATRALQARVLDNRHRVVLASEAIRSRSPLDILARGYALVTAADGAAVTDASQVAPGDPIRVRLHRGRLAASVTGAEPAAAGGGDD
jgi:exodeoxyribonuclease VII large subunit